MTDIATGWTETRSVKNKAQKWVFAALTEITDAFPFGIVGIDSIALISPPDPRSALLPAATTRREGR